MAPPDVPRTLVGPAVQPEAPPCWVPQPEPEGERPAARARRTGTVLAVLAALVAASAAAWPVLAAVVTVVLMVLARSVHRGTSALARRRYERGARGSDSVVAVVTSPWHLLAGALATAVTVLLPAALGVATVFFTGLLLSPDGRPAPGSLPTIAVGAVVALLAAWWGIGGLALRSGTRTLVRALAPGRSARVLVPLLLLGAAAAAYVAYRQGAPDWTPLRTLPLRHHAARLSGRPPDAGPCTHPCTIRAATGVVRLVVIAAAWTAPRPATHRPAPTCTTCRLRWMSGLAPGAVRPQVQPRQRQAAAFLSPPLAALAGWRLVLVGRLLGLVGRLGLVRHLGLAGVRRARRFQGVGRLGLGQVDLLAVRDDGLSGGGTSLRGRRAPVVRLLVIGRHRGDRSRAGQRREHLTDVGELRVDAVAALGRGGQLALGLRADALGPGLGRGDDLGGLLARLLESRARSAWPARAAAARLLAQRAARSSRPRARPRPRPPPGELLLGALAALGQRGLEVGGGLCGLGALVLVDRLGLGAARAGVAVRVVEHLVGPALGVLQSRAASASAALRRSVACRSASSAALATASCTPCR